MSSKREAVSMMVRLPPDMKQWLEREAADNAGSQNNEIVRTLRARMVAAGQSSQRPARNNNK